MNKGKKYLKKYRKHSNHKLLPLPSMLSFSAPLPVNIPILFIILFLTLLIQTAHIPATLLSLTNSIFSSPYPASIKLYDLLLNFTTYLPSVLLLSIYSCK